MDAMGKEAFRRNPQCALINANNPFMARRVETRLPKPKGEDNLFRVCEGQFFSCLCTKLRYRSEAHFIETTLACFIPRLERNHLVKLMSAKGKPTNDCTDIFFQIIKQMNTFIE